MDLSSIVHPQDTPNARKASTPTIRREDGGMSPTAYSQHRMGNTIYDQRAQAEGDHRSARPPYPAPIHTSSYIGTMTGNDSTNASQLQNAFPATRRKDPSRPSRSELFCQKLSHNSVAKVEPSAVPSGSSASSAQSHPSFNQSTPVTATSPGSASAQSSFQRPTSSHSIQTPTSAQYQSYFNQRSPNSSDPHPRNSSHAQYPHHMSQPHTPLGPPSSRPNNSFKRESPTTLSYDRTLSSGSNGYQQSPGTFSPMNLPPTFARESLPPEVSNHNDLRSSREKSMSVSPKTRIENLPSSSSAIIDSPPDQVHSEQRNPLKRKAVDGPLRSPSASEVHPRPKVQRSASMNIDVLLNEAPPNDRYIIQSQESLQSPRRSVSTTKDSPSSNDRRFSTIDERELSVMQHPPSRPPPTSYMADVAPASSSAEVGRSEMQLKPMSMEGSMSASPSQQVKAESARDDSRSAASKPIAEPIKSPSHSTPEAQPVSKKPRIEDHVNYRGNKPGDVKRESSADQENAKMFSLPQKKKPPRLPTPIWARSVLKHKVPVNGQSLPSNPAPPRETNGHSTIIGSPGPISLKSELSNPSQSISTHVPVAQPVHPNKGPLGQWEPSILNHIPSEDLVKVVSDFLFEQVVLKDDIGVGAAGGTASQGAVLEVEAKIGRLIDRNTNDRLRLPVMSECVVSHSDPNLRIQFESSMTENQHRTLNKFLNGALLASQPPKPNRPGATPPPVARIPISYKHTHETDTFFELTQKGALALPSAITSNINAHHHRNKTTIRVTNDQKTGKEIAKIVKARIADLDIYSPRTLFDYRISVNVEMNFDGALDDLVDKPPQQQQQHSSSRSKADRNKDRMSYRHLAYQIDLTQVTATEGGPREHELEIEVSSAEARRQGRLALEGQANQYEELVRGFLDNIRILARHCQT